MDKWDALDELNGMTECRHGIGPLEDSRNLQRTAYREALATSQANPHFNWAASLDQIKEVLGL